jgi:hypothetical protein
MTRNEVFESDRGETNTYNTAASTDLIRLPITRLGFEALLLRAANRCLLPVDDDLRKLLIGFVHSLDRKCDTTTIDTISSAMQKSYANQLTWTIDKEIDDKLRQAAHDAQSDLTVVKLNETEANH